MGGKYIFEYPPLKRNIVKCTHVWFSINYRIGRKFGRNYIRQILAKKPFVTIWWILIKGTRSRFVHEHEIHALGLQFGSTCE